MKRIISVVIIAVLLLMTGCYRESPPIETNSDSENYNIAYQDETHKEAQYGKMMFNTGIYHIVSETYTDDIKHLSV